MRRQRDVRLLPLEDVVTGLYSERIWDDLNVGKRCDVRVRSSIASDFNNPVWRLLKIGTLITQKEFWQALVAKAWQRFDYGAVSADQMVADLVRLGFEEEVALELVDYDVEA